MNEIVWNFLKCGCNANEIAAYYGVSLAVAEGIIAESIPRLPLGFSACP